MAGTPTLLATVVAILFIAADEQNDGREVKKGDTVIVAKDGVKLMRGSDVLAELDKDAQLTVTQVKGDWLGVHTTEGGNSLSGWVQRKAVALREEDNSAAPLWARIVLDEDLFPGGAVWSVCESAWGALPHSAAFDLIGLYRVGAQELFSKYGKGTTKKGTGERDRSITYHYYGPIGLGLKVGDAHFSWIAVEHWLVKDVLARSSSGISGIDSV